MREVASGVFREGKRLLTRNLVPGTQVYGERLVRRDGTEYRAWNPKRSKLAAAILKGMPWEAARDATVLYLGAANGTTASHVSDVVPDGRVVAVEVSERAMRDLLEVVEPRGNMIPVLADAHRPDAYARHLGGPADVVYQDIAQRDQVEILRRNVEAHLVEDGVAVLMLKARSVDVARDPGEIFDEARDALRDAGLEVTWESTLEPFEKDHRCFRVRAGGG